MIKDLQKVRCCVHCCHRVYSVVHAQEQEKFKADLNRVLEAVVKSERWGKP